MRHEVSGGGGNRGSGADCGECDCGGGVRREFRCIALAMAAFAAVAVKVAVGTVATSSNIATTVAPPPSPPLALPPAVLGVGKLIPALHSHYSHFSNVCVT